MYDGVIGNYIGMSIFGSEVFLGGICTIPGKESIP